MLWQDCFLHGDRWPACRKNGFPVAFHIKKRLFFPNPYIPSKLRFSPHNKIPRNVSQFTDRNKDNSMYIGKGYFKLTYLDWNLEFGFSLCRGHFLWKLSAVNMVNVLCLHFTRTESWGRLTWVICMILVKTEIWIPPS